MSQVGERDDAPEVDVEEAEVEAVETDEAEGEVEDEPEEDADEGAEDEVAEGTPAKAAEADVGKPKKGNPEYGALRRRAREAEELAAARERELNELRQAAQGRQTAEQRAVEEERLRLMPPEEKFEYLLKKQEQEFNGRLGQIQFQTNDSADRVAFESLCARNPAYAAVADDVESKIVELRRGGGTTTRQVMATYLIGERALARANKGGKAKQSAKGAARVASAASKPAGGRSDVRGGERRGGDEAAARRARLGDMEI